jgi:hypothetical protein
MSLSEKGSSMGLQVVSLPGWSHTFPPYKSLAYHQANNKYAARGHYAFLSGPERELCSVFFLRCDKKQLGERRSTKEKQAAYTRNKPAGVFVYTCSQPRLEAHAPLFILAADARRN